MHEARWHAALHSFLSQPMHAAQRMEHPSTSKPSKLPEGANCREDCRLHCSLLNYIANRTREVHAASSEAAWETGQSSARKLMARTCKSSRYTETVFARDLFLKLYSQTWFFRNVNLPSLSQQVLPSFGSRSGSRLAACRR